MEKSYANVSHTLKLAAGEMERLKEASSEAQAAGDTDVAGYNELVTQLVKGGYDLDDAITQVNDAMAKQAELLEGTFTQDLKEHGGAWKEFAAQAFENATANGHLLDSLTAMVQWFTNNALKPNEWMESAEFEAQRQEVLSGQKKFFVDMMKPYKQFAEFEYNFWKKLGVEKYVPFAYEYAPPPKDLNEQSAQQYFDFDADEAPLDPVLQPAISPELDNIFLPALDASKDITAEWTLLKTKMDEVVLIDKEYETQVKNTAKHIRAASDILGSYTKAQLKEVNREILKIIKSLEGTKDFSKEQMVAIANVLTARARALEMAPVMKVWQDHYNKLGMMDANFYDESKQRIMDNFEANKLALGPGNETVAEEIRDEDLFQLDEKKFAKAAQTYNEFFSLIGAMTEEDLNHRFMLISRQYDKDLALLGKTRAEMLKEEREYLLGVQTMAKPVAFYKRVYDELGEMSDIYYNSEQAKIDNEFKHNKVINEEYAKTLKARQEFSLTQKFIFADALDMSKDEIKALEEIFQKTGIASEALVNYWNLFNKFQVSRLKSMSGDEGAAQSLQIELDYKVFQDSNKKFVQQAEKTYAVTKVMDQSYIDYRISNIRMMTIAYLDSLEKQGIAQEEALNKTKAYEDSLLKGFEFEQDKPKMDLLKQGMADTKMMTEELYDFMAAKAAWERDEFIRITGEKEIAYAQYVVHMRKLDMDRLATSNDANDGIKLATLRAIDAQKTGAEKAAENMKQIVDGTKSIISGALFGSVNSEFSSIWDFFEDTAMNFKRMIDKMVADWLAAQIGQMMFGDLAGIGGPGQTTGGMGWLGAAMDWGAGLLGGGPTPLQMSGPFAMGAAFDRQGITRFARGGVVDDVTRFAYNNGTGEMGEAGPEGVLPLKRMSDGKLGVSSDGNQSKTIISPTIIVQAPEGRLPRESMNQITNNMGRMLSGSMRKNS
jgi:hypothetical protein